MRRWYGLPLLATALAAGGAMAQPVVDGLNIGTGDYGAAIATQRFQTGFGNDTDNTQFGFGNELDQMYVTNDATYLYVALSGNLENNGNCLVLFIDSNGAGNGANQLFTTDFGIPLPGLPRYLVGNLGGPAGFDNLLFDTGFAPDYALGISGGSPIGSQTRTYYLLNWTTLDSVSGGIDHSNQIAGLITAGDPTASGATPGTLGSFLATGNTGILASADNSNAAGVEGTSPPDFIPGLAQDDPASATKGFEFAIPLSLLGVSEGGTVCLYALISSSDGFFSNQQLPTDDTATEFFNMGTRNNGVDTLDYSTISGNQHACYTVQ